MPSGEGVRSGDGEWRARPLQQVRPDGRCRSMARGLIDWTVRTLMLVLAGLVTLSILGSIAAMSNEEARPDFIFERTRPAPAPPAEPPPASPEADREAAPGPTSKAPGAAPSSIAATLPEDRSERWLEAIAWTLLALAGLAALAVILLWQAVRQLRRIAERASHDETHAR